jgi:hypothetical protein
VESAASRKRVTVDTARIRLTLSCSRKKATRGLWRQQVTRARLRLGPEPERRSKSIQSDHQVSHPQAEDAWTDHGSEFVLITEGKPPPRIELARERLLICRLYLGLMRTITDDYGAEFAAHSDCLAYRTIGIYVFLRTVMCSPVRASQIAHALKLPRVSAVRRLEEGEHP